MAPDFKEEYLASYPVFSPKCCPNWAWENLHRSPMFSTARVSVMEEPSFPPRLRLHGWNEQRESTWLYCASTYTYTYISKIQMSLLVELVPNVYVKVSKKNTECNWSNKREALACLNKSAVIYKKVIAMNLTSVQESSKQQACGCNGSSQ